MLLMAESGLRRDEVGRARREKLRLSGHGPDDEPIWELTIIGKRAKERTVPVSAKAVAAIAAHWSDRAMEFETEGAAGPLLSPLIFVGVNAPMQDQQEAAPYNPDVLDHLVERALTRLTIESALFESHERQKLDRTSSQAFRHTFGTLAAAADAPIDVIRKILGHESLQTTSIYYRQ